MPESQNVLGGCPTQSPATEAPTLAPPVQLQQWILSSIAKASWALLHPLPLPLPSPPCIPPGPFNLSPPVPHHVHWGPLLYPRHEEFPRGHLIPSGSPRMEGTASFSRDLRTLPHYPIYCLLTTPHPHTCHSAAALLPCGLKWCSHVLSVTWLLEASKIRSKQSLAVPSMSSAAASMRPPHQSRGQREPRAMKLPWLSHPA